MPALKLEQFGGQLPAWDEHLLPSGQAAKAINTYLFSGALEGWRQPKLLRALNNGAAKFVYRIPSTNPADITTALAWLEFVDPDTNVLRSQVVDDTFQRYYFASPSQPPQYNTQARIAANQPPFLLGVPAPGCAPLVTVAGGGNLATLPIQGSQTDGGAGFVGANTVYLVPIVPTGAMTLQDVQFMPLSTDSAVNYAALLYSDKGGGSTPTQPGDLLNVGAINIGISAGSAALSAFANPTGLVAGDVYWIGILMDTTEQISSNQNSTTTSYSFPDTFSNGPTPVAPTGLANQLDLQMWADLQTDDVIEARAYVYTWVSAYGEEGPPSPPTLVNGWSNGTWTIGLYTPVPTDMGVNRNLTTLRLYRTVTASGGSTVFYFVADIPLGTTSYTDTVLDNVIALKQSDAEHELFPAAV